MAKVSFLGLGVMGYPMAGHLLKKGGHEVTVYNRSPAKAAQWVKEYGGKSAATPREAAQGADFVLMCVGNDDDVRSVAYGDNGVLAGMKKGAILVDHTTASASRRPGIACRKQGKGRRLRRRAGVRRPGRRGQRAARHHVRRRAGRLRQGAAGARRLRQDVRADRRARAPASSPRWSTRSASSASRRASPKRSTSPSATASTWRR